ncbi:MAG: hypothetical protein AB1679_29905 [Actinomycetota bacterium]|jgi:hypothetical protein
MRKRAIWRRRLGIGGLALIVTAVTAGCARGGDDVKLSAGEGGEPTATTAVSVPVTGPVDVATTSTFPLPPTAPPAVPPTGSPLVPTPTTSSGSVPGPAANSWCWAWPATT